MLLNDLVGMLMQVPPLLAGQWAAWFAVGLILSIWDRREKTRLVVHASTRHKSSVRQAVSTGVPHAMAARPAQTTAAGGDAFAELEALLEQPVGLHRMPGDAPGHAEAAADEPPPAAPRSLP